MNKLNDNFKFQNNFKVKFELIKMLETLQNFVAKVQQSTASSWLYSNQEIKTSQPTCCWRSLQQYTLAQVAEHCHFNDCWLVVYDKVYDVTHFLREVSCYYFCN